MKEKKLFFNNILRQFNPIETFRTYISTTFYIDLTLSIFLESELNLNVKKYEKIFFGNCKQTHVVVN